MKVEVALRCAQMAANHQMAALGQADQDILEMIEILSESPDEDLVIAPSEVKQVTEEAPKKAKSAKA